MPTINLSPIIKGTAFGFSYDTWVEDKAHLPSLLLSVIMHWDSLTYSRQSIILPELKPDEKQYGLIRNAIWGFESDLHNLITNYHLMATILEDDKYAGTGLKGLYTSLLVENYITNIRSIYDFCSVFPRIIMPMCRIVEYVNNVKYPDSLSTFIRALNGQEKNLKEETLAELPALVKTHIKSVEDQLSTINGIRNAIVHHGREPIVHFEEGNVFLKISKESPNDGSNMLPNILQLSTPYYPLFDYLQKLTHDLFIFMENLGVLLLAERKDNSTEYWALCGICVEEFNNFLSYNLKSHFQKCGNGNLNICYLP